MMWINRGYQSQTIQVTVIYTLPFLHWHLHFRAFLSPHHHSMTPKDTAESQWTLKREMHSYMGVGNEGKLRFSFFVLLSVQGHQEDTRMGKNTACAQKWVGDKSFEYLVVKTSSLPCTGFAMLLGKALGGYSVREPAWWGLDYHMEEPGSKPYSAMKAYWLT